MKKMRSRVNQRGNSRIEAESADSSSDCESRVSGCPNHEDQKRHYLFGEGVVRVDEQELGHSLVKHKFLSGLGDLGSETKVMGIGKMDWSSISVKARVQSFQIYLRALAMKNAGNANTRFAWFGCSKEGISRILLHGFGHTETQDNGGACGMGVHLSPRDSPLQSMQFSIPDEDGVSHMLLCQVLLGNMKVVHPCSDQSYLNSKEFDSGVDNLESPKRYIIWSTNMNTHILPGYVVSFRAPSCLRGSSRDDNSIKRAIPLGIPFRSLLHALSKFLPPHTTKLIFKQHNDYTGKNISRGAFVQQLRELAGDELLTRVMKSLMGKAAAPVRVMAHGPI